MHLNPSLPTVLLLLGSLGACAPASTEGPVQRLLRAPDLLSYEPPPGAEAAAVLFDASNDSPSDWLPIVRLAEAPTPDEESAFFATSSVRAGADIRFGGERGSWLRIVPFDPNTPVALRARLDLDGATGGARIALVEFSQLPENTDLATAFAAKLNTHWGAERKGDGARYEETLLALTSSSTRALGILCAAGDNPETAAIGFGSIRLEKPQPGDYLSDLGLNESDAAPVGYATIAMTTRPAVGVLPGSSLRGTLNLPAGQGRFESYIALAPHEHFGPGVEIRFQVMVDGAAIIDETRKTATPIDSRWQRVNAVLPDRASSGPVEVEFRTELVASDGDPLCVPVFATPRFVPQVVERPRPNVVLVSIDTLRADHVGCYGYEIPTTPRIDAFAEEAQVYLHTWAQGAYTLPSHMSMLSGQYASVHAVQDSSTGRDRGRTQLLAEVLRSADYTTGAFTAGGYLDPTFGFGRGFERYSTVEIVHNPDSPRQISRAKRIPGYSPELVEENKLSRVQDWIRAHAAEPFFLFFHTYAAHEFDPPQRYRDAIGYDGPELSQDPDVQLHLGMGDAVPPPNTLPDDVRDRIVGLYDAGILQADDAVGALLETLKEVGVWNDTIVIITSDHGKEIGEHGQVGHGHILYEEMISIPLIARFPGVEPARIETPAMSIDIVPTVLERLGLPRPSGVQGSDLLTLPDKRTLFAEVESLAIKYALLNGDRKTIYNPLDVDPLLPNTVAEENFDLARDPHEQQPLPSDADRVAEVIRFRDALRELSEAMATGEAGSVELDEAALERLHELGYTDEK